MAPKRPQGKWLYQYYISKSIQKKFELQSQCIYLISQAEQPGLLPGLLTVPVCTLANGALGEGHRDLSVVSLQLPETLSLFPKEKCFLKKSGCH